MKKIVVTTVLMSLLTAGLMAGNKGLQVRDVLEANYTNEVTGKLVTKRANEIVENNVSDVKAQISSVLENGNRHIRFVAALDSYLYDSVNFTISASNGNETKTLVDNEKVTRAYTHIEAADKVLSASDAFGEGYNYLVAYTINNVPESAWGYTFTATVTAQAEGYTEVVSSSADRVINDMINAEEIKQIAVVKDVRHEAEDCVIDGNKVVISGNPAASNGQMAANIDNCGQGLHFVHYSPIAGEFTMDIGYYTGSANSKHDVYVNNVKQGTVVYDYANGWADGNSPAATKSINITLNAGYNNITVIKNGVASDNPTYGGWVQVDYFDIKGGAEYDPNIPVDNSLNIRIEAELGNFNTTAAPVAIDTAQNGYVVGEINNEGNGSTMKVRVPESGKYELRVVYAKDGGARPININLDGSVYTYSLEDYNGQSWNVFHTSNVAATLELEAGTVHNLSVTRAAGSNWFCFDAIILTKVA